MNLNNNTQKRTVWNHFLKKEEGKQMSINRFLHQASFLKKQNREKAKMNCQTTSLSEHKPDKKKKTSFLLNKKGQGLIEYLILIALMGVATIGIIRTLNQTVKSRFANAIYALQGRNQKAKTHNMKKEEYQRSDLSNFMSGSASTDKKKERKIKR